MNPHSAHPTSLLAMGASLVRHRGLIVQLARRDVVGRYRGSFLGLAWSFVSPLVMLAIYTFVFGVVFRQRWAGTSGESTAEFALVLFSGMIVHGFFAECVNRAPGLVLGSPNLVKKVVFPLEILPWTTLGSALFHAAASLVVLLTAHLIVVGSLSWTVMWVPIIVLPTALTALGLTWALAALGVFVRDIAQVTGMFTTILLFLSPVFYPAAALPESYRPWLYANPLTPIIEDTRNAIMFGQSPDWERWVVVLVAGVVMAQAGFWLFQRTRRGFADVI
jgi:lipopolysaccharide transport system permease protein